MNWCPIQTSKDRVNKVIGHKIKWDWDNFTDIFSTHYYTLIADVTLSSVKQFALFFYQSYNLSNIYMRSILKVFIVAIKKYRYGTSLVAQWSRIRLPMQETQVRSLVWEHPTCHGATKPVHHNYWACALEPASHNYWARALKLLKPMRPRARALQLLSPHPATTEARAPRACAPQREATAMRSSCTTTKSSPCSPQLEKAWAQRWRPNAANK